jgi:hypothetical protein
MEKSLYLTNGRRSKARRPAAVAAYALFVMQLHAFCQFCLPTGALQVIRNYAPYSAHPQAYNDQSPLRKSVSTRILGQQWSGRTIPSEKLRMELSATSQSHGYDVKEAVETDADRTRRRYILFSMLASVSASPLVKTHVAKAEEATLAQGVASVGSKNRRIIRPPLDDREYVTYTLKNGLRVLLCSDPSSNEAAAAMDVHVGACSDPAQVPGLAHFTEHMLFLGTKGKNRQFFPNSISIELSSDICLCLTCLQNIQKKIPSKPF